MANYSPTLTIDTVLPEYQSEYDPYPQIADTNTTDAITLVQVHQQVIPAPGIGLSIGQPNHPLPPLPDRAPTLQRPTSTSTQSNSLRSFSSQGATSTPHQQSATNQSTYEKYPPPDPFVEALQHTVSLQQLCTRCIGDDASCSLYMGQLITALTQLLRKARELDALDPEEEDQQLKDLRINVKKLKSSREQAAAQRAFIWKRASLLLLDIRNRLAEEHVATGLKGVAKAIREVESVITQRRNTGAGR